MRPNRIHVHPILAATLILLAAVQGCDTQQRIPIPSTGGGADNSGEFGPVQGGDGGQFDDGRDLLGLFVGKMSGTITGSTLVEVRATGDTFLITTIVGAGFVAAISSNGVISVLDMTGDPGDATGNGVVIGINNFTLNVTVSGSSAFGDGDLQIVSVRVPGTDAGFPLDVTPLASGSLINNVYFGTTTTEDPAGGGLSNTLVNQQIFVNSLGSGTTVQLPSQDSYTGVAYAPVRSMVRVVANGSGGFGTLAGSSSNTGLDVLGRIDFVSALGIEDTGSLSAILVTQSRDPLGFQIQQTIRISAERSVP